MPEGELEEDDGDFSGRHCRISQFDLEGIALLVGTSWSLQVQGHPYWIFAGGIWGVLGEEHVTDECHSLVGQYVGVLHFLVLGRRIGIFKVVSADSRRDLSLENFFIFI